MIDRDERMVEFDQYCCECKYAELAEEAEPCCECLEHPVNIQSKKPVYFKAK